jgi:hypothetical protein
MANDMNLSRAIRLGDHVRLLAIPDELAGVPEETLEVFALCVGEEFIVEGFNAYGHAELNISEWVDPWVDGIGNTIWVEIEYLEKVESPDQK